MGYLKEGEPGIALQPLSVLRENLGFIPGIFRAQSLRPAIIGPETELIATVIARDGALSRLQKECILLLAAAALRNPYWVSAQYQTLQLLRVPERQIDDIIADHSTAGLSPATTALLSFVLKLCRAGPSVQLQDINVLADSGVSGASVLEAVVATALGDFMCTLSTGLGTAPDFGPRQIPERSPVELPANPAPAMGSGPYLAMPGRNAEGCAALTSFREAFGFVPNILMAQIFRPDIVDAECNLMREILLSEGGLDFRQRRYISIAVSAANLNTNGVALHSGIAKRIGIPADAANRIALGHHALALTAADTALLDCMVKLTKQPSAFGLADIGCLHLNGFDDLEILDAVLTTSLTRFLDTLQFGLGANPDFEPLRTFDTGSTKILHPEGRDPRPITQPIQGDPDTELVEKVQAGDFDDFEALIERHSRRVYRTLLGILGNPDDARDAMQETFLKAFQHIGSFQQRAKFSTWLVSIASNTAIQRIRDRKDMESLDDSGFELDEGFRPRQIQAWTDDPEKLYSRVEVRTLVEKGVMSLPSKYRVVVMLRDIEQFPIEEAARALGLGIPAVKARLLRGRLMLREALSPHFVSFQGAARNQAGMKGVTS